MKTTTVARGFIGAVASLLGVVAAGCSAGVADEASAGNGEIGSVEQAIGLAGRSAPGFDALFPVSITLASGDMFVAGGYDSASGNLAGNVAKIFDGANPGTWVAPANASTTLPTATGEASIIKLPGVNQFLIVGGQDRLDKSTATYRNQAAIYDETNDLIVATGSMVTGSSNMPLVQCGSSKVLAVGGRTGSGSVSGKLEVFTPNATPANGTWAALEDVNNNPVTLATPRTYHGAVALDSTHVLVFAGEDAAGNVLKSVELITFDSNCDNATIAAKNDMPLEITQFAFAKGPSTSRSVIVAGGSSNLANSRTETYLYDNPTSDTWTTLASTLNAGAVLPVITTLTANTFKIVGGTDAPIGTGNEDSMTQVQDIDLSVGTPAWSAIGSTTQLSAARVGHAQALVGGVVYASQGVDYVGGSLSSFVSSVE
jgi:hypothetical protein